MKILWFIPTFGDTRYIGSDKGSRETDLTYLIQVAQAVDNLGYYGALLPTGRTCDDPWIIASALIAATRKMRFLVAVRPGFTTPSVAARMAATFDNISGGRLLINIVAGGDPVELAGDGIFLDHDERYQLTEEFLDIWKGMMAGEKVNYTGAHLKAINASLFKTGVQAPYPELYFGGSSAAGQQVAAKHVDVYLTWGEPLELVKEKIDQLRSIAAAENRELRFGIRFHVIVRETEEEAWKAADELIQYVTDEEIQKTQQLFARSDSTGQQRQASLHNGRRDKLMVAPNLWAGIGLVRKGAGLALVGGPENIAARIKEYTEIGIDEFILSGYPHLEEAYRFAELVFPLLKDELQHEPVKRLFS